MNRQRAREYVAGRRNDARVWWHNARIGRIRLGALVVMTESRSARDSWESFQLGYDTAHLCITGVKRKPSPKVRHLRLVEGR